MNVLIVDDEEDIGFVISFELKFQGHTCTSFTSAEKAQEFLLSGAPVDVVICDFQMPRMNGLMFFKWMVEKNFKTPFYILTGEPTMDKKKLLEQGVTDVLYKPQDLNKLAHLIK